MVFFEIIVTSDTYLNLRFLLCFFKVYKSSPYFQKNNFEVLQPCIFETTYRVLELRFM